jgi:Na+-transporting methylmalonyl-CoA/oxaloacetate decarboxylase gamma subunit
VTDRIIADAMLIVTGVGVLALWLIAAETAVWLIRTRTRRTDDRDRDSDTTAGTADDDSGIILLAVAVSPDAHGRAAAGDDRRPVVRPLAGGDRR